MGDHTRRSSRGESGSLKIIVDLPLLPHWQFATPYHKALAHSLPWRESTAALYLDIILAFARLQGSLVNTGGCGYSPP